MSVKKQNQTCALSRVFPCGLSRVFPCVLSRVFPCALSRVFPFMKLNKWVQLMNAFFKDQINYSPLVWMFHRHNKISKLYERYVRVT